MKRREFIAALGGAATAWPLVARAQQPAKVPVIGFLNSGSLEAYAPRIAAFREGFSEAGYVEGKTAAIEFRHADGQYDRLPAMAADLVRLQVAVIVTVGITATSAAKAATTTIPVVFSTSGDPVALGLITSLARPGGNLTGTTRLNVDLGAKRLSLLHEMAPAATTIALLINPRNPASSEALSRDAQAAARKLGLKLDVLRASNERELDETFVALAQLRTGALMIGSDAFLLSQAAKIAAMTIKSRIPAISQNREFVDAGGLVSFGGRIEDGFRIVGAYTGRILKGEKPADLPVQQSTKIELMINLKTANLLGLTIPPMMLAQADEVIE